MKPTGGFSAETEFKTAFVKITAKFTLFTKYSVFISDFLKLDLNYI